MNFNKPFTYLFIYPFTAVKRDAAFQTTIGMKGLPIPFAS